MQEQVIKQILSDTDVICCTNVGAADRVFRRYLPKRIFDLVVIDQCGQSLQVSCWIPILKGQRVVLAGDHKQLPPTIQGNVDSLLSHTLFTRSMQQLKNITSTMLKVQYRMNKQIRGWSNEQFYDNQLMAHQSVQSHTLRHLLGTIAKTEEILMMVNTQGVEWGVGNGEEGDQYKSKVNVGQADITISIYKKLLSYQIEFKLIAILTLTQSKYISSNHKLSKQTCSINAVHLNHSLSQCRQTLIHHLTNIRYRIMGLLDIFFYLMVADKFLIFFNANLSCLVYYRIKIFQIFVFDFMNIQIKFRKSLHDFLLSQEQFRNFICIVYVNLQYLVFIQFGY